MPGLTQEARLKGAQNSVAARKRKAAMRADARARMKFENAAEKMASILIDAALGEGDFKNLEPKERAQFALKALEYGVGRPRPQEAPAEQAPTGEPGGLHIMVGAPQGDMIQPSEDGDA